VTTTTSPLHPRLDEISATYNAVILGLDTTLWSMLAQPDESDTTY